MNEPLADGPGPTTAEIDVRYYGGLMWRHRRLIAVTGVACLLLGILVGFLQTQEFQAAAMVQIDPPTPLFLSVNDALLGSSYWQNTDFYNTQFKILKSSRLGEQAVAKLKLDQHPPFKDSPDPGAIFMAAVTVTPVPESRLVMLQVTLPNAKEAALWANTLADLYIDYSIEQRVDSAKRAYDWLQDQLAATRSNMQEAQEQLLKGYQSQDLFVPEGSTSAVSSSITRLTEDFISAQARRIDLEAALRQIGDMQARNLPLDSVPQVSAVMGDFRSRVSAAEAEVARLRQEYKPAHPEVQRAQSQLDEVLATKNARIEQVVDALRVELDQLRKKEAELKSAIDGQKSVAATQSRKATELEALKREADSTKSLYDVLLQKLHESDIASSIRSNNTSVVERARPPSLPSRPNRPRIAGIGLVIGILLGVGLVLAGDLLQNTVKDPDDIERFLHIELLAAIPRYDKDSAHLVTEAYQNLRTALIFARKDEGGQVVLVTGTAPQEGKTTTLVNLGKVLAGAGERTLLIDCDLRRAQLHARLGIPRSPGFTDHFVHHEELAALTRPTDVPNLEVIPAGPLPPSPPSLLGRKALPAALDELRRTYDWVLVDSPPLASVTDALLLARYVDMVIFVVQHNKVDKIALKRQVAALQRVSTNLLGAVLNVVDLKARGYYYYYYHQQNEDQPAKAQADAPRDAPVA